jgi:hypothetical protein
VIALAVGIVCTVGVVNDDDADGAKAAIDIALRLEPVVVHVFVTVLGVATSRVEPAATWYELNLSHRSVMPAAVAVKE